MTWPEIIFNDSKTKAFRKRTVSRFIQHNRKCHPTYDGRDDGIPDHHCHALVHGIASYMPNMAQRLPLHL